MCIPARRCCLWRAVGWNAVSRDHSLTDDDECSHVCGNAYFETSSWLLALRHDVEIFVSFLFLPSMSSLHLLNSFLIFSPLFLFYKNWSRLMRSSCYLCSFPVNFWIAESVSIKPDREILASEPISTAYCKSRPLVRVSMCIPPVINRQRLSKNVTARIEEFVRFEVFTVVIMKNAVFWDIKTQFVPHRKHISAIKPSRLMLFKIWRLHGGDCEECRLLGYITPVRTLQETHYVCCRAQTVKDM
jgi:hypothetical protein